LIVAVSPQSQFAHFMQAGHQPAVRVWDLEEKTQVAEFFGHKYGIACVVRSISVFILINS